MKIKAFFQNLWWRFRLGLRKTFTKLKNVRFTKRHFKYWLACIRLDLCFLLKGAVALCTLHLVDLDITARASTRVAQHLGRIRAQRADEEFAKVDKSDEKAVKAAQKKVDDAKANLPVSYDEADHDDIQSKLDNLTNKSKKADPWRYSEV